MLLYRPPNSYYVKSGWLGWMPSLSIYQELSPISLEYRGPAGSPVPVMCKTVSTVHCIALWSSLVQLPYQAGMQSSHICVPLVQVREGSVEGKGDGVIGGPCLAYRQTVVGPGSQAVKR